MEKLDTLTLRVMHPEKQKAFYRDMLGMLELDDRRLAYSPDEVALNFIQAEARYVPQPNDLYWKIAISVPDINLAHRQLAARGVTCSEPKQFRDVGLLAHAQDPEGFVIELIDHWFEGERPEMWIDESRLGGGPTLNLVTLRTDDIARLESEILEAGMRPLSVQPVESHGFTLYFYAFTNERPPKPDLTAIENRTWVYQRPYSVLEIQHLRETEVQPPRTNDGAGYESLSTKRCRKAMKANPAEQRAFLLQF